MKSYKLTLRRRHKDGQQDEVVFKVEHDCPGEDCACSRLDEAGIEMMLVDAEYQTNSGLPLDMGRGVVRAWVDEDGR